MERGARPRINAVWLRAFALFPEHADNPEWEIGDSRISKLWIQRLADKRTVFNWDRGADVPAADHVVACIVDFLAAGLADHIYAE